MPKVKRISKKQLKKPDEFITTSAKVIKYVSDKRSILIPLVIGLFLVLILALGFRSYFTIITEKSSSSLASNLSSLYKLQDLYEDNKSNDITAGYKNLSEEFFNTYHKYPRTSDGKLSLYYAGYSAFLAGETDMAISHLKRFVESTGDKTILSLGLMRLAEIYFSKGEFKEAIEAYERIIGLKGSPYIAMAHYQKAMVLKRVGRIEESRAMLNKAKKEFEGDFYWKLKIEDELLLLNRADEK